MNTQINKYLKAICLSLIWVNFSYANSIVSLTPHFKGVAIENSECAPCDEPAPNNFKIIEASPSTLKATWDPPTNQPHEYNIKVFLFENGSLLQNFNKPGSTTEVVVTNLAPNTTYEVKITPVCEDGTMGTESRSDIATTSIIDLIVSGYSAPPSYDFNCTIDAVDEYCNISPPEGNVVLFRIFKTGTNQSRDFGVFRPNECDNYVIKTPAGNNKFSFACDGSTLTINYLGSLAGNFAITIPEAPNTPRRFTALDLVTGSSGFQVQRIVVESGYPDNQPGGACPGSNRSSNAAFVPAFNIAPNPFTNQLDIQVPTANINESIELNLYDLQGRRVMVLRSPGGQQTITLNTGHLSPGIYFLRVESGGLVQTVKVVKTQ